MSFTKCVVVFSLFVVVSAQSAGWCNLQSCRVPSRHIACNNDGRFYSRCISPKQLQLTSAHKQLILDGHNNYRNIVASGKLQGFAPAKRMAKLTWNNQLESLAELNTKQCDMDHDACRNTASFRFAGQNLAGMGTSGTYSIEYVINDSLKMWFNEYSITTMNQINKYASNGKKIGHFTAMVTDRTTQVGCAISTYKKANNMNTYLLACNYASTNILGVPVYKSGSKASACSGGPDSVFTGLCKTSEMIDPNAGLLNG